MKNDSLIQKTIYGFFFIAILGTLSHFFYEWSGNNNILGAIVAVNESVWEHLKIAVIPGFIWAVIEYFSLEEKNNFYIAKLLSFITIMLTIIILFYGYTTIFGGDSLIFDIATFYIAIALGQYVSYKIMQANELPLLNNISAVLLVLLLSSFIVFTYMTPKCEIFRNPINNTYGIEE